MSIFELETISLKLCYEAKCHISCLLACSCHPQTLSSPSSEAHCMRASLEVVDERIASILVDILVGVIAV